MKNIFFFQFFIFASLSLFSQKSTSDSLINKSFCLQIDLPGLLSFESRSHSQTFESPTYAPTINISIGFMPKKDFARKYKRTILFNYLQYNSTAYINMFKRITTYSAFYNHVNHFSISAELKIFFDKKMKKRGFFGMLGAGFSQQKIFGESSKLYENKIGWNIIANAGYQISIKKFYFEFNGGVNSFFVSKANNYKINQGNLNEEEYFNWLQTNFPDNSLKAVKFKDSNTVTLIYKTGGLMKSELLPVIGVNFGFRF